MRAIATFLPFVVFAGINAVTTFEPASLSSSSSLSSGRVVVEKLSETPAKWNAIAEPSPTTRLYLRVALPKADQGLFEQVTLRIATPGDTMYGQHLTRDGVKELMKAKEESVEAVLSWLSAAGIADEDVDQDGQWINFYAPVSAVEELLETRFHVYQNADSGERALRALHYSVPRSIADHLTMIQPTTRFSQANAARAAQFSSAADKSVASRELGNRATPTLAYPAACGTSTNMKPACLRAIYNVNNHTGNATSGNKIGVTGFLNFTAKYSDLELFLARFAPYAIGSNFTLISINNGTLTQDEDAFDSSEANLDVQYAISLAYPANTTFYATGGVGLLVPDLSYPTQADDRNEPYLDFLTWILAQPDDDLPQTLTTSYGEDEQSVPEPYARTVCDMFGALGARGVSVIFASGDSGVGGNCQKNDGSNATWFNPVFPASCPWVTSVGATTGYPEQATRYSAGGFSDYWQQPTWQSDAVGGYLKNLGDQWSPYFNASGRGFPDVATQGTSFDIFSWDFELQLYGTSCSSPTFASIISLVNDDRLSRSQPPLGFLNPWLYSLSSSPSPQNSSTPTPFNDVVLGGSSGCTGNDPSTDLPAGSVPYASWNATLGWDPVTGLGTPDFQGLLGASRAL